MQLKPDEDPIPIERHMTTCDFKGKGKDLAFVRSEYVDIITKNNCPKGKWLAQNNTGKRELDFTEKYCSPVDRIRTALGRK